MSTRLLILNSCTGNCKFTYLDSAASPSLTSLSASKISISGSNTKSFTATGLVLVDAFNFAEAVFTNTIDSIETVFSSTSANATSVSFDVTNTLKAGTYDVSIRNAIGQTDPKTVTVEWVAGTASWSSGGSTAGALVSLTNGGGYPSAIDGKAFSV